MWYVLSGAALAADRTLKCKARRDALPESALRGHIRFHHIENDGLAGSKLRGKPCAVKFIHLFAYLVSIPFLFLFCWDGMLAKCGVSLIAAGGGSNLFDRLRRGTVTDMLQFPHAPGKTKRLIFNAADLMIFLGALLTLPTVLRRK